jgi:ribose transport system ATP-binding protein
MTEETGVLVAMNHIVKAFGRAVVLNDVGLRVRAGEVHALLGENGAGKSTLMKVLAGVHRPDAGTVVVGGVERTDFSVRGAHDEGISMVYQELSLVPQLSVAQNLMLGREGGSLWGRLHDRGAERKAAELLTRFDTRIRPGATVSSLAFAQRQITEILKALAADAKVIVLDEPTASLTPREEERLFDTVRGLKEAGVGVVYISHRLGEVLRITDRITVLRNGQVAGTMATEEATVPMLVEMMSGTAPPERPSYRGTEPAAGSPILRVRELGPGRGRAGIDFDLRRGEVLGVSGLISSGRSTLLRHLFGLQRPRTGQMTLLGKDYQPRNAADAVAAGVVLVPEDRREQGIFPGLSVEDNLTISFPRELARWPALRGLSPLSTKAKSTLADNAIKALRIKTPSRGQRVGVLSGGTQQKIVFGKWLIQRPALLLLDEPTAGVDVNTKNDIWQTVRGLAKDGVGVLYSSSDAEELATICDRVLVVHKGQVVGELTGPEAGEENAIRQAIQNLSSGAARHE